MSGYWNPDSATLSRSFGLVFELLVSLINHYNQNYLISIIIFKSQHLSALLETKIKIRSRGWRSRTPKGGGRNSPSQADPYPSVRPVWFPAQREQDGRTTLGVCNQSLFRILCFLSKVLEFLITIINSSVVSECKN